MRINIEDITYENTSSSQGGVYWSDIIYKDNIIGALCETYTGLLKPSKDIYQMCVSKDILDKYPSYNYMDSEDIGYYFIQFENIDGLVDFINHTNKKGNK